MAGKSLVTREIKNGRMLKNNGSWMYCDNCNNTVGYLCYSTYHNFEFNVKCLCGTVSSFKLTYSNVLNELHSYDLNLNKNRYCCGCDQSPLFSLVSKNIESYKCKVTCDKCGNTYTIGRLE